MKFKFPEEEELKIFLEDILEEEVDEKYYNWFKIANKITVAGIDYLVMREGNAAGTPSNPKGTVVAKRAFKMVRLVLVRND